MKGKTTFREAAIQILEIIGRPLHYKEMMREIIARNVMEPTGKTPAETLRAMMMRDIKADEPCFGFFGDGKYGLSQWSGASELPDSPSPKDVTPRAEKRTSARAIPRHPHPPRTDRKLIGRIGQGDDGTFLLAWIKQGHDRFLEISQILEDQKASDSPMGSILLPAEQIGSLGRNLLILAGADALQDLFSQLEPHELPGATFEDLLDEEPPPPPDDPGKDESESPKAAEAPPSEVLPPSDWRKELEEALRKTLNETLPPLLRRAQDKSPEGDMAAPHEAMGESASEEQERPAPRQAPEAAPEPSAIAPPLPEEEDCCGVKGARSLEDVYAYLVDVQDFPALDQFRPDLTLTPLRSIDYLDRFQGCLLGFAIGDAMGAPLKGLDPDGIRDRFGGQVTGFESGETTLKPAGGLTDDTLVCLEVCRHLVEEPSFSPEHLARQLSELRLRDLEPTFQGFRRKLCDHGLAWYEAGIPSDRIGAAKRTTPFGLARLTDAPQLRLHASMAAFITHRDDIAIAAAVAHAFSIGTCCNMTSGVLADRERLLRFCEQVGQSIAGIERSPHKESIGTRELTLYERIARQLPRVLLDEGLSPEQVFARWHCGSPALEALPVALYCFLRSPDDFQTTLVTAVNGGGDCDTIAALACSLSGAYNGRSAIPSSFLDGLRGQDRVEDMAQRMYRSFTPTRFV